MDFLPSWARGRGAVTWTRRTGVCVLLLLVITILVVLLNFPLVRRTVRLREWSIFRFHCVNLISGIDESPEPSRTEYPSPEKLKQNYISHAFHPTVGIGNLLFMYASLWGIAKKNKLIPTVRRFKLHDVMEIDLPPENFFDLSDCSNLVFGKEDCCIYDELTQSLVQLAPGRNISLWGYFQTYRYFHPEFQDEIRRQLRFKPEIVSQAESVIDKAVGRRMVFQVGNRRPPIVGIHVRRGDVLDDDAVAFGHTVATKEYYSHALDFLRGKELINPVYIVCTNDPAWVRENLPISEADMYLVEDQGPVVDLAVLSMSDHLILSVGTYSFFIGYLSHAQNIIYYSRWPLPGSDFAKMTNLEEFWLPEWIPLE